MLPNKGLRGLCAIYAPWRIGYAQDMRSAQVAHRVGG